MHQTPQLTRDLISLRYRACMRLSVRLIGPPRFITKRIGLARFVGGNPKVKIYLLQRAELGLQTHLLS